MNLFTRIKDQRTTNYRRFFKESPAPMYIFDLQTLEFLAVNNAALKQYGYTRKTFLSMRATDIRPPEEKVLLQQTLQDIHEDAYFDYGRWLHKRSNGEIFYVHIYAHASQFRGRKARVVMALDIDRKVKAEKALLESEGNLRATINNSNDLIWSIDTNWNIISGNNEFYRRMYHVTGNPRIERINAEDFKETDQRIWTEHYTRGFAGETLKMVWHEKIDGKDTFHEINFNPILDESKKVLGLSCISRDITENHLYTKRIEEQNAQLRKIAWTQSHEVRGPLSDILGLIPLIEEIGLSGQKKELMDLVKTAAKKLDDVIKKIMQETRPV